MSTRELLLEVSSRLDRIEDRISAAPTVNTNSRLVALYSARVDGVVTVADVLEAMTAMGGITIGGLCIGTGASLVWNDPGMIKAGLGAGAIVGGGVAIARLVIDWLQPGRFITEWNEFVAAYRSGEWQEFVSQLQPRPPAKQEHTITIEQKDPHDNLKIGHIEGPDAVNLVRFAQEYQEAQSTAEKYYIGPGKIWPRGNAGRDEWLQFWELLYANGWGIQHENKRRKITHAGRAVLRHVASIPLPQDC